jgi:adenylate cyclase
MSYARPSDEARPYSSPSPGRVVAAAGLLAALLPLVFLAIVRARPTLDAHWESQPAHFWLVLGAATLSVGLGHAVAGAARRRGDARLFLVSLAFIASAGFLGLHALATPGVLVGPNPGFEFATPVGLVLGGGLAAASTLDLKPSTSRGMIARSSLFLGGMLALFVAWAVVSLQQWPPLNNPLQDEELNGWQALLGVVGVAFFGLASLGYGRLYLRRRASFALVVALAFALLAEAMIVIGLATNWKLSWWEWHILMLAAFLIIFLAARREWPQERFSALYLEETLAGVKDAIIIFADLQGYTSFAEKSEPEQVAAMLNTYFAKLAPLMQEYGGDVYQLIGDEMMVVFNKEGTQPDHPLLAARAALALRSAAQSVASAHPDWPRFRIGVNSGQVLAGVLGAERGHRTHGLVGDTVNLAARLQTQAPVGHVVVGQGTFERLPPGSRVTALSPLKVKGKSEAVSAYLLDALPEEAL